MVNSPPTEILNNVLSIISKWILPIAIIIFLIIILQWLKNLKKGDPSIIVYRKP